MRIRQKFFVPLQPYGKEYRRDTIIPSASAWERLENQGSPFGRFQREHICRGGILQGRHRDGRQAPPHIRFSPRACLETPGHVAIQDVHQGTHTPLQDSGREVCQRTGSLGRCRRAHDRSARKKTIDTLAYYDLPILLYIFCTKSANLCSPASDMCSPTEDICSPSANINFVEKKIHKDSLVALGEKLYLCR